MKTYIAEITRTFYIEVQAPSKEVAHELALQEMHALMMEADDTESVWCLERVGTETEFQEQDDSPT